MPLADQTQDYATTPWSCVKDNTTGLIWEVKTDDGGIHDKDNTYSWYTPDNTINGGDAGTENGSDDTDSFVTETNTAGLCGATTWRLPTIQELYSLNTFEDFDNSSSPVSGYVAIDTSYFPNTANVRYISASSKPDHPASVFTMFTNLGRTGSVSKSTLSSVRLVRSQ